MTEYRRLLHHTRTGSSGADEDWWDLVFDEVASDLYVEHRWQTDFTVSARGNNNERIEVSAFLKTTGYAATRLKSILPILFPAGKI